VRADAAAASTMVWTSRGLIGQTWGGQADLWAGLDERREMLNTHLPTRGLEGQVPLVAYRCFVD